MYGNRVYLTQGDNIWAWNMNNSIEQGVLWEFSIKTSSPQNPEAATEQLNNEPPCSFTSQSLTSNTHFGWVSLFFVHFTSSCISYLKCVHVLM